MRIVYILLLASAILLISLIPIKKSRLDITKYITKDGYMEVILKRLEKLFILKLLVPIKGSKRYANRERYLKRCGLTVSQERLGVYTLIFGVICFLIAYEVGVSMSSMKEQGILNQNKQTKAATLIFKAPDEEATDKTMEIMMNKVLERIPDYKKYVRQNKMEELGKKVYEIVIANIYQDKDYIITNAILKTLVEAEAQSKLEMTDYLIMLCASWVASVIVDGYLKLIYLIRQKKSQKEFARMEMVVLLKFNQESIDVLSMLREMKAQSDTLKPYISQCIKAYPPNPTKALDNLSQEVDNKEFTKFIAILKQCLNKPKDVNKQILKIQRDLRQAIDETENKQKNSNKKTRLTLIQLPLMLIFALMILMPLLSFIAQGM